MKKQSEKQLKTYSIEEIIDLYVAEATSLKEGKKPLDINNWLYYKVNREYKYLKPDPTTGITAYTYYYTGPFSRTALKLKEQNISAEQIVTLLMNNDKFKQYMNNVYIKQVSIGITNNIDDSAYIVKQQNKYYEQQVKASLKQKKLIMEKSLIINSITEKLSKTEIKKLETTYKIKIS
jgi:hypothetical protein